jgi:hypothetical protein
MKSEPLYIVAGDREQFDDFVIRKRSMGHDYDFKYVYNVDTLRGLSTIRGFYIGSYQERNDWPEINVAIQTIKSRGG